MLSGVALILARLWVEIAMMNLRLHEDGTQRLTAEQLRDLVTQIPAARAFSTALLVVFIAAGPAAAIWARRTRGTPPAAPWPRGLAFPSETDRHRLDTEQVLVCRADGVFSSDDALLVAISGCQVPLTPISAVTYWSAQGVAAFSVHGHSGPSLAARWTLTSWAPPLTDCLQAAPDGRSAVLHRAGETVARLVPVPRAAPASSYDVVAPGGGRIATMERFARGWECRTARDLPSSTRRLIIVASRWAEQRYVGAQ
jgi:antitoxin (DNA-binding transcriptional repressor) of toxin-antitoxin stability system